MEKESLFDSSQDAALANELNELLFVIPPHELLSGEDRELFDVLHRLLVRLDNPDGHFDLSTEPGLIIPRLIPFLKCVDVRGHQWTEGTPVTLLTILGAIRLLLHRKTSKSYDYDNESLSELLDAGYDSRMRIFTGAKEIINWFRKDEVSNESNTNNGDIVCGDLCQCQRCATQK
ncbi:hypothetical protein [Enterovibrio paralichthyis]|uniref:hypothetical protein n=1 Tax=Enterovibrio paralichthyis TaxID=2853805 RepID=UPI001C437367|nr:hypothetical protein [Enterovibrio paralichthyis]MBV7300253.1 hypothetical protein [Enterovibrio paralichthyis]